MGGKGSGRQNRTKEIINSMKGQQFEPKTPISTEMFLPNVSNVQDFARKDRPDSRFTQGSILFADVDGRIAQDNTNFFWDDTNDRLRIGTGNAPIATLDVMGDARTLKLILSRGGIGIQEPYIEKTDNKGMGFFTLDNHRLNISVGGNFDFKAGNMVTTGNLNINDATLSGQINLSGASTNIITATNVNGDLRLGAGGGTNDLKIDKNGNVDIFENLTMGGAILGGGAGHDQFSDFVAAEHLLVGAIDHDLLLNFVANEHIDWTSTSSNFSTSGTVGTGVLTATGGVFTGDVTITDDDGETLTLKKDTGPNIRFEKTLATAQVWSWSGEGSRFVLYDVTNSSATPFVVEAGAGSNTLVLDSNSRVGIGTVSPGQLLTVSTAGDARISLVDTTAVLTTELRNVGGIGTVGTSTNDHFAIMANGEKIRVQTNGNVGIGVVPPANTAGLVIEKGSVSLKEITTPTADTNYGKIYTKTDNKLYFQDGAGTEHEIAVV